MTFPTWLRVGGLLAPLVATGLGPVPAVAQGADERDALLRRIELLERRLQELERRQPAQAQPRQRTAPQPAAAAAPAAAPATPAAAPATPPGTGSPPAAQAAAPAAGARPASPASGAPGAGQDRARAPTEEDIPQEAFVFRDQAVTLRPGRTEVSGEISYSRDRRTLSADRIVTAQLTGRVGLLEGVEGAITVSQFFSNRTFETGPGLLRDEEQNRFGDITVQISARAWGEGAFLPGAVVTAGVVAPTGPSPYIVPPTGISEATLPVNITRAYNSRGTWTFRTGLTFFKTVDPLVMFAGVAYDYFLPFEQDGANFHPGPRINYNAGVSFAVSDRTTLGASFIGSYTSALRVNDVTYRLSAVEAGALRFQLVQRLGQSFFIEPSINLGLVSDSPSFQAGLGMRYRF